MARRRYQRGTVFLRGCRRRVWVGRWWEDELTPSGVVRHRKAEVLANLQECPTKRLAHHLLEARLSEVNSPTFRARPTATFREFAEKWQTLVLRTEAFKPSSRPTARCHLKNYLLVFFGNRQLREIHTEDIQRFLISVRCKAATIRRILTTFRSLWNSARAWGYVAHDPFEGVRLPQADRQKITLQLTPSQARQIIHAAPEPLKTMLWLATAVGMRAGEILGLAVHDIDFERNRLVVRQSAWEGKLVTPKTVKASRVVAISPRLAGHLGEYISRNWKENPENLLFSTRTGNAFAYKNVLRKKLYPLLESLGLPHCGFHVFRHVNATFMDRIQVPLAVRQERLGHADPRLTLGTYTHIVSEDEERLARAIDEFILDPNGLTS